MNPLDELGVRREHIISLKEAYTQTNKKSSEKRAQYLKELFDILKCADYERMSLDWELEE